MEKIPVCLLNWNDAEMTERCLDNLNRHTDRSVAEIYVFDNGSDDPNLARLQDLHARRQFDHLICFDRNLGFSLAYNRAFEQTTGELVCCLNNDCLVESGWLDALIETLRSDDRTAAACSNVYHYVERRSVQDDREVSQLFGAIMLFRRSAWESVGGFDDKNFSPIYGEEMDWSYRAVRLGYKLKLSGRSLAYHLGSYSSNKNYDRSRIRLIRLTHRIKCRLFNWTMKQLLVTSWKSYYYEIVYEIKNGTVHLFLPAFLKNLLILPTIWSERRKRFSPGGALWGGRG